MQRNAASGGLIAGVDEAGRGPLAGPVVASAVILDAKTKIKGLKDSKLLSETEREALFKEIRCKAIAWSVAKASVREIDDINILQASLLAMQRAVHYLKIPPQVVLVDGNFCPSTNYPTLAIIKGDQFVPAISAASIVAKVLRDRLMKMFDKKYPAYGFAQHKGYSTLAHKEALEQHGPCRIHRKSFAPVTECLEAIPAAFRE